jgi:hypothetical protein
VANSLLTRQFHHGDTFSLPGSETPNIHSRYGDIATLSIQTSSDLSKQAYPGACLVDLKCYGGSAHGMVRSPLTVELLTEY